MGDDGAGTDNTTRMGTEYELVSKYRVAQYDYATDHCNTCVVWLGCNVGREDDDCVSSKFSSTCGIGGKKDCWKYLYAKTMDDDEAPSCTISINSSDFIDASSVTVKFGSLNVPE